MTGSQGILRTADPLILWIPEGSNSTSILLDHVCICRLFPLPTCVGPGRADTHIPQPAAGAKSYTCQSKFIVTQTLHNAFSDQVLSAQSLAKKIDERNTIRILHNLANLRKQPWRKTAYSGHIACQNARQKNQRPQHSISIRAIIAPSKPRAFLFSLTEKSLLLLRKIENAR